MNNLQNVLFKHFYKHYNKSIPVTTNSTINLFEYIFKLTLENNYRIPLLEELEDTDSFSLELDEFVYKIPIYFVETAEKYKQIYKKFIPNYYRSAMMIFDNDTRKKLSEENPDTEPFIISLKIYNNFKLLSEDETKRYDLLAEKEYKEYLEYMSIFEGIDYEYLEYKYYKESNDYHYTNTSFYMKNYEKQIIGICDDYLCDDLIRIMLNSL